MKETPQKVVILNNFSSPYVKEAIIVLKNYNPKLDQKAIADAEMIVSQYLNREKRGRSKRNVRKFKTALKLVAAVFAAVLFTAVFMYMR